MPPHSCPIQQNEIWHLRVRQPGAKDGSTQNDRAREFIVVNDNEHYEKSDKIIQLTSGKNQNLFVYLTETYTHETAGTNGRNDA